MRNTSGREGVDRHRYWRMGLRGAVGSRRARNPGRTCINVQSPVLGPPVLAFPIVAR